MSVNHKAACTCVDGNWPFLLDYRACGAKALEEIPYDLKVTLGRARLEENIDLDLKPVQAFFDRGRVALGKFIVSEVCFRC